MKSFYCTWACGKLRKHPRIQIKILYTPKSTCICDT